MARLRYVTTDEPGYYRKRYGRGFTYTNEDGDTIRDKELRQWFASIAIPPAWTDVWISPYQNGHILATGRDDKGRKQYRYHPEWYEIRNQKKFDQLYEFGQVLPRIREVTDAHLRQRTISRERVLAAIIRLMEQTLIRIGNEQYAQQNDSYGLTTLTDDHVDIADDHIVFEFVGKSGKEHTLSFKDKSLARVIQHCQDLPGYRLFQYHDENNTYQAIDSVDVNDYLHTITGGEFTAKVFRTWGGSILAIKHLCEHCTDSDPEASIRDCVEYVAQSLGNTKAICRKYYIHPLIADAYQMGTLHAIYNKYQTQKPGKYGLMPEEKTLMHLIESMK
jgi:DNA topoisomerase I